MLRFDPFSDMDAWTRGMMTGSAAGTARTPRFMPLDLYKVEDHYLLIADLPGADPGSIDVSVDNGGVQWLTSERFSGTYRRQLTLGDAIDSAAISARYDNGVLTVTIPVAEKAKPRRIEVESAGRPQAIETSTVT